MLFFSNIFKKLKKIKRKKAIVFYLSTLNQFQHFIFTMFLQKDYLDRLDDYEKKMHQHRLKVFLAVGKLRKNLKWTRYKNMLSTLIHLYEIMFSLYELNQRVKDRTLFDVCAIEFKSLSLQLDIIFKKIMHKEFVDLDVFSSAIVSFDELFRSTLQIISPEPIIFLFFVQDLLALYQELTSVSRFFNKRSHFLLVKTKAKQQDFDYQKWDFPG